MEEIDPRADEVERKNDTSSSEDASTEPTNSTITPDSTEEKELKEKSPAVKKPKKPTPVVKKPDDDKIRKVVITLDKVNASSTNSADVEAAHEKELKERDESNGIKRTEKVPEEESPVEELTGPAAKVIEETTHNGVTKKVIALDKYKHRK